MTTKENKAESCLSPATMSHATFDHHHHGELTLGTRLYLTLVLNLVITAVQVAGGLAANSLALLTDALHNLSDALAVGIAAAAEAISGKPRTKNQTFGYRRAQVLAAMFNGAVLVLLAGYLMREAVERFLHPEPVTGGLMAGIAAVGLAANLLGAWLLQRDAKSNMNVRAAWLHLFSDAATSLAVLLGGLAISWLGWWWLDPAVTVIISIVIAATSVRIVAGAAHILMQGAPLHIDSDALQRDVMALAGIQGVHHLHLWSLTETDIHCEAHLAVADMPVSATEAITARVTTLLRDRYGVTHYTLHYETGNQCCAPADCRPPG